MPKKSDAAVGRLAIMDAALNDLLRDLVVAIRVPALDVERLTTGQAAQGLLKHAKTDPALLVPDVRDWLKRVDEASKKRNKVMHAVAKDQCVLCGDATRFEHKGQPVDRSVAGVTVVSAEFRDLIDEGVRHVHAISETLNERARADAAREAAATGQVQGPSQILIGQTLYRCGNCSPGGQGDPVCRAARSSVGVAAWLGDRWTTNGRIRLKYHGRARGSPAPARAIRRRLTEILRFF